MHENKKEANRLDSPVNADGQPRVFIVSFPRSGHHALMGFLNKVSDLCDDYCEFYNCTTHNGKAIECPKRRFNWRLKGNHCGAGRRITKSHDFDLSVPIRDDWRYVVQYRHPLMAVQSWYELESRNNNVNRSRFIRKGVSFWCDFIEKWVLSTQSLENVRSVEYQSLDDAETIRDIVEFCGGEFRGSLDKRPNFQQRRDADSLPEFMREMEQPLLPMMNRAGIEPLFDQKQHLA